MENKKRILHLLSSNQYSGAENVACTIIQNTNVISYYCCPPGDVEKVLQEQKISYIPFEKKSVSFLRKIVQEYQIDIIHAHDFKASFLASSLNNEVKIVSHLHCNYKLLKLKSIVSLFYCLVQKKFSKIIVVSKEILEDASFGKKIAPKTVVLDNVVDPKKVIKLSEEFSTSSYDLIFVGRLIGLKQPLLFIDIINEIKKKHPNIKAAIIGQGELYEACTEKINCEQLADNIDMIGFVSNPFPYIKNSKIAVLPSKFEGLPMSVIEALILNVPVVNSGVGGLQDMFKQHPKYICQTKNDYVQCILTLLELSPKEYTKDCQSLIKKFTDIKAYGKKIETIYNDILNRR